MGVIRLTPDLVGPNGFAAPGEGGPGADDGAGGALDRMQARDDALFVSTALAGLMSRQGAALGKARESALADPDPMGRHADGLARRLDSGFAAEAEELAAGAASRAGPRPSDAALDLFRRRAGSLRAGFGARAAVIEDGARKAGQLRGIEDGLVGLAALVEAEPDGFGDALARLDDMARAGAALMGEEAAAALRADGAAGLAAAAVGGLIARDPDAALARIGDGAFDEHLDRPARQALTRRAERRKAALAEDERLAAGRAEARSAREAEAASFAFLRGFVRAVETGEATHAALAEAVSAGTLTAAHAAALRARWDEAETAREAEATKVRRASETLGAGTRLDPDLEEDRDAAAAHFAALVGGAEAFDAMAPAERIAATRDYAALTGIVPDDAAFRLAGDVMFGDPPLRAEAARAMEALAEIDPGLRRRLSPEILDYAERLEGLRRLGAPAVEAASFLDSMTGRSGAGAGDGSGSLQIAGKRELVSRALDWLRRRMRQDRQPDPGLPLPPIPGDVPRDSDDERSRSAPPGIGHNGPPEKASPPEDAEDAGAVADNELRPGIKVRGNPNSRLWRRFTDALSLIPGEKPRHAAEGLVNGGELTTDKRAGTELSNITRKGGMKESLEAFDRAIEESGTDPDSVKLMVTDEGERRWFEAPDGTTFQHRTFSTGGHVTIDIQIERPAGQWGKDIIKIRFEEKKSI